MTNAEKHGQKERMNSEKHREKHGETNVLMHVCLRLCLPMLLPVFLLINLTGFLWFFSLFICQFFARVIYLFIALMFLPILILHNIGKHSWDGCDWQRKPTQTEAFATSKKIMLEQICLPKTKFLQVHFWRDCSSKRCATFHHSISAGVGSSGGCAPRRLGMSLPSDACSAAEWLPPAMGFSAGVRMVRVGWPRGCQVGCDLRRHVRLVRVSRF